MSTPILVLVAFAAAIGLFSAAFLLARRMNNYGIVDIVWSYAFGGLAVLYAWLGTGWPLRRVLFAALVILWSVRLGSHLFRRVMGHHPEEDSRYREMRVRWAANFAWEMFKFFQWQALSVVVLGLPFLLVALNPAPQLHPLEVAGACLWFIALVGEALADAQLAAFKRNPANRGRVCDVGLWRASRHPNYFFEWLVWVAYFVFALASPWGWLSIISPLAILYLLLRVTGIPMTEEQLLRSRGEAYRTYQRTTSAFFPWFRRRAAA
jgi:steroid 5-alpha reductase family enzyme